MAKVNWNMEVVCSCTVFSLNFFGVCEVTWRILNDTVGDGWRDGINDDISGAPGRCRAGSHPGHRCGANCSESGRNDVEVHSPLRESRDDPSDQRIIPGLCRNGSHNDAFL